MRSTREKAPKVPEMSLVRVCSERCLAFVSLNRATARLVKPIAFSTSALRALESATALRSMTALWVDCGKPLGHQLGGDCKNGEHESAGQRQPAEPGMQHVDEDEVERHPGQVEQRNRPLAAQEAAHRVDVAAALQGLRRREAETRHVDRHLVRQRRDPAVEPGAQA